MLKINNVSKSFGGVKALDCCSFDVEKGKVIALIGPNGSGKTTLFDVISGLVRLDSGSIKLNGFKIDNLSAHRVTRLGVSRTFQDTRLFRNLFIRDHFLIALLDGDESVFCRAPDLDWKIKEFLDLIGLKKSLDTLGSDLSYGQRKLLDLGLALAKPHDLLMLDEPVAGVNPFLREKIKEIIKLLKKKGETVFLIEHDMDFVMDLADGIFVLDAGRVIASGSPKEIQNNKKVLDAYLGE